MTGADFVVWLFMSSFSFWVIGFGIGCIVKMLNQ